MLASGYAVITEERREWHLNPCGGIYYLDDTRGKLYKCINEGKMRLDITTYLGTDIVPPPVTSSLYPSYYQGERNKEQ